MLNQASFLRTQTQKQDSLSQVRSDKIGWSTLHNIDPTISPDVRKKTMLTWLFTRRYKGNLYSHKFIPNHNFCAHWHSWQSLEVVAEYYHQSYLSYKNKKKSNDLICFITTTFLLSKDECSIEVVAFCASLVKKICKYVSVVASYNPCSDCYHPPAL